MKNPSKSGKKVPALKVAGSVHVPRYQQREAASAPVPPKPPTKNRS